MTVIENLELPYLHICYQKDLRVLFCRWRMPVELAQFSEGYMAALRFAAQQDAHFWLHDLRLRNAYTEDDRHWFVHTFAPAAHQVLGGSNYIAYLMSPLQREFLVQRTVATNENTKSGSLMKPIQHSPSLAIHYFTNEHDALEWLEECRFRAVA